MKASFSRWLPAIAHTRRLATTGAVAGASALADARVRLQPAIARTRRLAGDGRLPILGHPAVPRRAILLATGLTVAAAIAGGQVTGATDPGPTGQSSVAEAAAVHNAPVASQGGPGQGGSGQAGSGQSVAAGQDKQPEQAKQAGQGGQDKPAPQAAPSMDRLIPHGTQGPQSRIPLSGDQVDNAKAIVDAAKKMGLPERAAVIGVATSLQESKLDNLGHLGAANDHDSLGLFQQRPSSGWGTPDQVTNPQYAASAFFNGLKRVPGWQDEPLTDAAQSVQVSAYPFAYAQWEQQAADVVHDVWNG